MSFLRRLFNRKPKSYLFDDKFEIIPAFTWNGETYYMHKDPLNTCAGRGLTSLVFMEELLMRCDVEFLKYHISAFRAVFNNPNGINILQCATLLNHLEERVNMLAAIPDHVFKMASVVFFTKNESPIHYDQLKGAEKVKAWKETEGMYDFFFADAVRGLNTLFAIARSQFKGIFGGGGKDKRDAFKKSPGSIIQTNIGHRHTELMFLSGDDPIIANSLERDTVLNYYFLLNKKMADIKAENARRKKLQGGK